jgi:hypothetical protein
MIGQFLSNVIEWFELHPWVVGLMTGLSLLTIVATFVIVPWAIVRIPSDYFAHNRPSQTLWERMPPGLRMAALIGKNLLGAILVLVGIVLAMPLVPGPGVLTILAGLALLDLPGKRRLERWIVAQPPVFNSLNKLRAKYGRPPLDRPGSN